jgi:hypothetical protein
MQPSSDAVFIWTRYARLFTNVYRTFKHDLLLQSVDILCCLSAAENKPCTRPHMRMRAFRLRSRVKSLWTPKLLQASLSFPART